MILKHRKQSAGTETQKIFGILFDGAWLWEEYIHTLVPDIFYHPMNKSRQEPQCLFEKNYGKIYPDFISKNCNRRIIADAKYKPQCNIKNNDYFQLLAYMLRFNAKTGYFLYPQSDSETQKAFQRLHLNGGSTYEKNVEPRKDTFIAKYGLKIPAHAENYDELKKMMLENEQAFREHCLRMAD